MSINMVTLIGRVGKDPVLRRTTGDVAVANFSVATDEGYTKQDGTKVERTEWHNIVAWGKLGEHCAKYLAKGRLVCVEGKLQTRSWDNQGQKHYITEIIAKNVEFLDSAQKDAGRPNDSLLTDNLPSSLISPKPKAQNYQQEFNVDDIPF